MRLTMANSNTFFNFFTNRCEKVQLEPHGGISQQRGSRMSDRKVQAKYLGVKEAEELTGVSRWTWRRYAYTGVVESIKIGKRLLISSSEIERLVAEGTRPRFKCESERV